MEAELTGEEREAQQRRKEAQSEKELGNAAYKKRQFEAALEHYGRAIELDATDITFRTNRAAVYLEMGKVVAMLLVLRTRHLCCVQVVLAYPGSLPVAGIPALEMHCRTLVTSWNEDMECSLCLLCVGSLGSA